MRVRRRRSLLTGLGVALAAAMLVAALVVSDSLGFGFDRAARAAGLPDIIVRFDPQSAGRVAQRIAALPDLAAYTVRTEVTGVGLETADEFAGNGAVEVVGQGRRGYAIVAGRDVTGPGQVVVERGLAAAWHLDLGGSLAIDGLGPERIVGFSESPDNVSYPLAVPRVYVSQRGIGPLAANLAEIWLRDPRNLNEVLVQARATSYGLRGLRFVTRSGVRVLLDQAAGIVIDLLVALSLIALATASVMLAASARAEVQRRIGAIGVRRAVGASRAHLAGTQAFEALFVAAPAATIGAIGGAIATYGPTSRLLMLLNEPAPGVALLPALAACGSVTQGGDFSGGTIQHTTGAGIALTSTTAPSFNNMRIQTTAGSGVDGGGSRSICGAGVRVPPAPSFGRDETICGPATITRERGRTGHH